MMVDIILKGSKKKIKKLLFLLLFLLYYFTFFYYTSTSSYVVKFSLLFSYVFFLRLEILNVELKHKIIASSKSISSFKLSKKKVIELKKKISNSLNFLLYAAFNSLNKCLFTYENLRWTLFLLFLTTFNSFLRLSFVPSLCFFSSHHLKFAALFSTF